jgi:hypothetical protein
MKWVYLIFAILGGLAPTAYLYARTYAGTESKVGAFDLGLVFLGLGLSFMVMPIGVVAGLMVAGLLHLGLSLLQRRRRSSVALAAQGENQHGARHSWVMRDLGKQDPPTPTPGQEDVSRHGSQPPTR